MDHGFCYSRGHSWKKNLLGCPCNSSVGVSQNRGTPKSAKIRQLWFWESPQLTSQSVQEGDVHVDCWLPRSSSQWRLRIKVTERTTGATSPQIASNNIFHGTIDDWPLDFTVALKAYVRMISNDDEVPIIECGKNTSCAGMDLKRSICEQTEQPMHLLHLVYHGGRPAWLCFARRPVVLFVASGFGTADPDEPIWWQTWSSWCRQKLIPAVPLEVQSLFICIVDQWWQWGCNSCRSLQLNIRTSLGHSRCQWNVRGMT